MDEELLERLRRLMQQRSDVTQVSMPAPPPAVGRPDVSGASLWVRELAQSPTADSLYRVGGSPRTVRDMPNPDRPIGAGAYQRERDEVEMHPYRDLWEGAYTREPNPVVTSEGMERQRSPRETFAHEIGHRGRQDEPGAEAFMHAFDVLSKTGDSPSRDAVMRALAAVEGKKPGTQAEAERMLEHPSLLFQSHPGRRRPTLDVLKMLPR